MSRSLLLLLPVTAAIALFAGFIFRSGSEQTQASGPPNFQWLFYTDPATPARGEPFSVTIYPTNYTGYPLGSTLTVTQPDPPLVQVKSQDGFADWTLTPLRDGKVLVSSEAAFETWDCPPGVTPSLPPGCPSYYYAQSPQFSITVRAPMVDSDGDGCPDQMEEQTASGSQTSGGLRDFQNPDDYFNPTHDGQNRVDDILLVVGQYFKDDSDGNPGLPPYDPGYNADTDRTLIGPNAWNLGAPNGQQRVDDILNIVHQYFHDCS